VPRVRQCSVSFLLWIRQISAKLWWFVWNKSADELGSIVTGLLTLRQKQLPAHSLSIEIYSVVAQFSLQQHDFLGWFRFRTVLHILWLKLLNLLVLHPSSDLCTGSRLMNALNTNSYHSPTKFLQPANLTTYTILSLFSLQVELAPRLLSP